MLKLDTLNQLKQLKSDIKANRNLMTGTVKGSTHKFGFVSLDSGKDVFLPPDEMEKVIPGDRIEVEVIKDAKNKKVAKIERLLSSPTNIFCGKYITKGKAHFIEADIPGMNRWFFVPPQKRKNAQAKDLVKCKISQHPFKSGNAQASMIEVIGTDKTIGIERKYACKKYDLAMEWNKEVEAQLSLLNEKSIEAKKISRKDFTSLPFVTIDDESTRDIDDALFAEKTENGWCLSVAIADPCALIEPGSAIEKEALRRATSIYFPGAQIPMLPELLASDLCSLLENKERLAKIIQIQVSDTGELGEFTFADAVIKSRRKMSYTEVSRIVLTNEEAANEIDTILKTSLTQLKSLSDVLFSERQSSALVYADRKDFVLELDDKQKIKAIKQKPNTIAHGMVEESMVAANRCVAKLLSQSKQDSIFIKHNGVRSDRAEALQKVLNEHVVGFDSEDITSFSGFVSAMKSVSKSDDLKTFHLLMSRQLEKSCLSPSPAPHFGMGLREYTTFTSPLRKAQDFLVHRQLESIIENKSAPIDNSLLVALDEKQSHAKGAVYDVAQWLKCQYLANNKDQHAAKVRRIFSTGFHVQLLDSGIEGFVSTKEMEGKFSFNQELLTLSGKLAAFELDQVVNVRLKQIDWARKQIQLEVVFDDDSIDDVGFTEIETSKKVADGTL